jgi:hypothetical protein
MAKKDLSSLKARLAKKTGDDGADLDGPPIDGAPPTLDDEPRAAPAYDIPAPGQTRVEPEPVAAAPATAARGIFDPNAGVIDDGGATQKGGAGAIIGVAVVGLVVGVGLGWVLAGMMDARKIAGSGKTIGARNVENFSQVKNLRAQVAEGIGPALAAVDADPVAGADQLTTLITSNFEPYPKVDDLFGWQLGSLHPEDVRGVFSAYDGVNRLAFALGTLATFVNENGKALAGGPSQFAVAYEGDGATLVEFVGWSCNIEAATPCAAGQEGSAVGLVVRDRLGGDTRHVPSASAARLNDQGAVYQFVFRENPADNAKNAYAPLRATAEARLTQLAQYEAGALAALERFAQSPTVNEASAQPSASGPAPADDAPAPAAAPADGGTAPAEPGAPADG